MRKDVPLAIEVPSPDRDKPAWVKVGVIAAVGFIVGVAWPRLVGVRLGPSAPGEAASAAASGSGAAGGRAPDAPPGSAAAKANGVANAMASATSASATTTTTAAAVALPPKIVVTKGTVITCKTTDGEKKSGKECGPVAGLDLLVRDKVKGIATCGGVEGQTGKFALIANADFKSGRFWYEVNKGATVQNIDAISACLKNAFHGQAVTNVPHEHPRYTVSYSAVLSAEKEDAAANKAKTAKEEKPEKAPEKTEKTEKAPEKPDDENKPAPAVAGEANVAWEVALVRDAPKVGAVVARLPRGTKVKLGAMKDGWYSVKFGDDFGTDGWVYRGAVGR
jgi:hypothetical protein